MRDSVLERAVVAIVTLSASVVLARFARRQRTAFDRFRWTLLAAGSFLFGLLAIFG